MARRNSTRRPHPCLVGYAVLTMVAQATVVAIFLAGAAVWSRGTTDGLTEHRVSFPAIILAAIAAALVLALTCGALARRRYTAIALSTAGLMASAVLTGAIGWTLTLPAPGPEAGAFLYELAHVLMLADGLGGLAWFGTWIVIRSRETRRAEDLLWY